ncbi:MAG TPA: lipid II-degrading bacteriocin [Pseudomonas sp.]|uniref:lipid II-degrading bacteriocin n=1 Tax=Pseudomonas sp. TaxID=306 RepID=UPI002ED8EC3D
MNNTITLPATYIKATAYNRSPNNKGNFGGPPLPPRVSRGAAAIRRSAAYLNGNWQEIINSLLTAQFNNPHLIGPLKEDLTTAHYADQFMCLNPNATTANAWLHGLNKASVRSVPIDKNENELSGGLFSPMKALAHAISGEGTPLHIKIENTGIKPTPINLPALRTLIENAQIGSSPVHIEKAAYNSGIDSTIAGSYLGNITLKISGIVNKYNEQHFTFTGEARAYHDTYDADASSHRSWLAEAATTALRVIMEKEQSKPYEIVISGSLPLHYSQ